MKKLLMWLLAMVIGGNAWFAFLMSFGPYPVPSGGWLLINCLILLCWCVWAIGEEYAPR